MKEHSAQCGCIYCARDKNKKVEEEPAKQKIEPITTVNKPVEFKEPTTREWTKEMMEEVEVTLQLPRHVVAGQDGRMFDVIDGGRK